MKKKDIVVSNEKQRLERLLDFSIQDKENKIEKELSKNRGFVQMYFDKLDFSLNGNELKTFLYLCNLAFSYLPRKTEYAYVIISSRMLRGMTSITILLVAYYCRYKKRGRGAVPQKPKYVHPDR